MRRMLIALGLVVTVLATVAPTFAQISRWDRQFVASSDGATYVVLGPMRHRIHSSQISDAELAQFQSGEVIATVDDLLRILGLGDASAPPATVPGPPPPANPAASLLGASTCFCGNSTTWDLKVLSTEWLKALPAPAKATAEGMWVFVLGEIKNVGKRNVWPDSGKLMVRDERGRTWGIVLPGNYSPLENAYGARSIGSAWLEPGKSDRVIFAFDVAADAQVLEFVPDQTDC